MQETVADP